MNILKLANKPFQTSFIPSFDAASSTHLYLVRYGSFFATRSPSCGKRPYLLENTTAECWLTVYSTVGHLLFVSISYGFSPKRRKAWADMSFSDIFMLTENRYKLFLTARWHQNSVASNVCCLVFSVLFTYAEIASIRPWDPSWWHEPFKMLTVFANIMIPSWGRIFAEFLSPATKIC